MSHVALIAANMTVNVIAVGLIVLGIALFVVTIVFWRGAVEDPPLLAPLEVMQDRKFARSDVYERTELLNKARTPDAPPLVHTSTPPVLLREPRTEPERPYSDPFPHDDDAVDIVYHTQDELSQDSGIEDAIVQVIDPLLKRQNRPTHQPQQRPRR